MAPKTKGGLSSSAPKKSTTDSSSRPSAPPRGNPTHSTHSSSLNKHGIIFVDDLQREKYDALVARKISAPKYIDVELLQALRMWDDVNALLGHLGWPDYVHLQFPVYEKLVWEFFNSFTIDTVGEYHNGHCYIRFQLGHLTHEMNLARFSELAPGPQPQLPSATAPHDAAGLSHRSSSAEVPLRQFLSNKFARLHLRLDHISEQHSQDHAALLHREDEWDRRQRNLEHHWVNDDNEMEKRILVMLTEIKKEFSELRMLVKGQQQGSQSNCLPICLLDYQ
ncbi:hypothetical protein Cgig2_027976 [Carnegiea gigantea]|uniref:Uncharacterized protein n=1 Tax=Carnegiea gigantea TaxID=171969 RepID=A0A9Q1Q6Z5_9CARY|nr:hypothetical protein Cgig2_027976 [Carnegiea gigantea]